MQITIKSSKVAKTGTSKNGEWELIVVTSEDNTEYTTFDKKVKHLTPGSVIDIGEPVIKEGKVSFKEVVKVISEPAATQQNHREKPVDAVKAEICARARNTALMQAVEVYKASEDIKKEGILLLASTFAQWLIHGDIPKDAVKPNGYVADLKKLEFKNKQELYDAALKYLHLLKAKVDPEVSGYDLDAVPQLKMAWLTLIENYGR